MEVTADAEVRWPARCYLVCATPRSGSTLLCELLRASGRMGEPREYLDRIDLMPMLAERYGTRRPDGEVRRSAYLRAIVSAHAGGNGVFGLKLVYDQLETFAPVAPFRTLVARSRFVWLRRRDLLAQSVSAALAQARGQWHRRRGAPAPVDPPYDRAAVDRAMRAVLFHDAGWRLFFEVNGIAPLILNYEDLLEDADAACRRVCAHVGIDDPPPFALAAAAIESMATDANRDWIDRYRAALTFSGTGGASPRSSHSA